MSLEALSWAIRQEVFSSSQKFILILLGNYAGDRGIAYPSIESLCKATQLTDDTVRKALNDLVKQGFIEDTGKKAGSTGKIRVFRLPPDAWSASEKPPNYSGVKSPSNPRVIPEQSPNPQGPPNIGTGTGTVFSANAQKTVRPESLEDCVSYGQEIELPRNEVEGFFDFFSSNGWKVSGRAAMKDWKAAMRNWKRNWERNASPPEQKMFKPGTCNL